MPGVGLAISTMYVAANSAQKCCVVSMFHWHWRDPEMSQKEEKVSDASAAFSLPQGNVK